jgi:DNA-binding winged helix-turn-helix (wHTH) protein
MKDFSMQQPVVFEFDGFSFDRERCLLSRHGSLIPASRKVLEMLACLLDEAPNPVGKSQLMARVWPGVVIEETGLHRNISLLRKLLSSQSGKQYVETIPKVGYRFIEDVKVRAPVHRNLTAISAADAFETNAISAESQLIGVAPDSGTRQRRLRIGAASLLMSCVLVTVVACYSLQPASSTWNVHATAVTTHSQERPIVAAAINAEGTQIAYAERDALFVKGLGDLDATEVQLPVRVVPSYIRWIPGDQSLLLSATEPRTQEPTVWIVSLNGQKARELIRNGSLASVSADGSRVAFVRDRATIWISDTREGGERELAAAPGNFRFVYPPQFSADGNYVFDGFYNPADPHTTIEARRVSDGQVVTSIRLPRLQAFTLLGQNALLLSVFSSRGIPPVEIAVQKFDLIHGALGSMHKVVQWPDATAYKLTASADAHRVVLIRDRTQSDVYLADLAPQTRALQNVRRLTFDDAPDFPWGWTPDSKNVLFHSLRAATFHVYEQSLDKTVAHDLAGDARDSKWPLMTADGRWLLYFSETYPYSDGPQALNLLRRQSGTDEPTQVIASFAHDDVGLKCALRAVRCILIEQTASSSSVSELDVDTGSRRHLFDTSLVARHYQQWTLSPDGNRLALLNDSGIHVYQIPTGTIEREIGIEGTCALRALSWDAEGQGFYLSKTSGELGTITHVSEIGEETTLFSGPMSGGSWVLPSPDGRHLAFQQWMPSANAWMLEFDSTGTRADAAIHKLANLSL